MGCTRTLLFGPVSFDQSPLARAPADTGSAPKADLQPHPAYRQLLDLLNLQMVGRGTERASGGSGSSSSSRSCSSALLIGPQTLGRFSSNGCPYTSTHHIPSIPHILAGFPWEECL